MQKRYEQRGFTLVELLVVIGIAALLSAAIVPFVGEFFTRTQLNEYTQQSVSTLRRAAELSQARYVTDQWGVYFEENIGTEDRMVLFKGANYGDNPSYDRVVTYESGLNVSSTLPSGEVTFSLGKGLPDATGTVTLTHAATGETRTITINAYGLIEAN